MSSPVPGPPVINAAAAASVLCEYFLANAERADHAANDELVAELLDRIRARQQSPEGGLRWSSPWHPADPPPVDGDGRG